MALETITNHLIKERSPYLKSAAHQLVRWHPWHPGAFQEAQKLDRPILLDIGAAWCHWCHVIDRESYENEEISKIINENFIAIKVDRDERPDIDARYQMAVGALTGQGGWPLTAFLTPQGEVFFGGTYFPPEDAYGQPGFKRILERVIDLYTTRKVDILNDAKKLSSIFENPPAAKPRADNLNPELIENCKYALKHHFDFTHGGFGNAPKFFHPAALDFILNQYFFTKESWLRAVIEKTLTAMGKGGVYDQLGGGFHRYSVDERWVVPHFEKMSYDNAALLSVYSKAFQLFDKPFFREILRGILHWAETVMTDKQGGFYASQDADVNLHDDGDYYTWTRKEAESLLTQEESWAVLPYFDIEDQGEMHHDPSRNVLFVAREPEVLARDMESKPQEVTRRIESGKQKLLKIRGKRKTPFVDQTLYTNWNGLWIQGYFTAFRALGDSSLKNFAQKTLDRFMTKAFNQSKGMARYLGEEENLAEGFLEDQVEICAASLDAFEITADPKYLEFAKKLAQILVERFGALEGGFFDVATLKEEGHLKFRERKIQDSPTRSSNSTAISCFLRLYHLTGKKEFLETAETSLRFFYDDAKSLSHSAAGYILALDFYLKDALKVTIVGPKNHPSFAQLHKKALSYYHPHGVTFPVSEEAKNFLLDPSLIPLYESKKSVPQALVCIGKRCLPITESPEELSRLLENEKNATTGS